MVDFNNLTDEEKRRLEKLLSLNSRTIDRLERVASQDEKMEWLWSSIRRMASFVAIIIGSIVLFFEQLRAALKAMLGG